MKQLCELKNETSGKGWLWVSDPESQQAIVSRRLIRDAIESDYNVRLDEWEPEHDMLDARDVLWTFELVKDRAAALISSTVPARHADQSASSETCTRVGVCLHGAAPTRGLSSARLA